MRGCRERGYCMVRGIKACNLNSVRIVRDVIFFIFDSWMVGCVSVRY